MLYRLCVGRHPLVNYPDSARHRLPLSSPPDLKNLWSETLAAERRCHRRLMESGGGPPPGLELLGGLGGLGDLGVVGGIGGIGGGGGIGGRGEGGEEEGEEGEAGSITVIAYREDEIDMPAFLPPPLVRLLRQMLHPLPE